MKFNKAHKIQMDKLLAEFICDRILTPTFKSGDEFPWARLNIFNCETVGDFFENINIIDGHEDYDEEEDYDEDELVDVLTYGESFIGITFDMSYDWMNNYCIKNSINGDTFMNSKEFEDFHTAYVSYGEYQKTQNIEKYLTKELLDIRNSEDEMLNNEIKGCVKMKLDIPTIISKLIRGKDFKLEAATLNYGGIELKKEVIKKKRLSIKEHLLDVEKFMTTFDNMSTLKVITKDKGSKYRNVRGFKFIGRYLYNIPAMELKEDSALDYTDKPILIPKDLIFMDMIGSDGMDMKYIGNVVIPEYDEIEQ